MTTRPAQGADAPLFEALLVPYRSLGRRGFHVTMALFGGASLVSGLAFLANGAWPIVGFFGLDVLLLWIALRASFRSAQAREEVSVSRTDLSIRKISPRGAVSETHYYPGWTRFLVRRHPEFGVTHMSVTGEGRATELGAFLNPDDRDSFAKAFGQALADARRG
ncbi:DUF2244 domain-containing protein [Aureimonas ureilytica]|uniref:DUF2244 domain-containing protein n=1 Tax=Aureimonas ureilytica TaxID=401562 RepID=UPI003CF12FAE